MVYLSIEDDTKDLYFFINSPGGWVIAGLAIYDTMQFVRPEVHTVCMGLAASMGSFLLAAGELTKRLAFPHAWRQ
ncbi:clp protease proteolytic subunit [Dorcoceras hygrometricum]|uniref:ATP-dependent Clp protease proteolytic subunit n=1 Tax=Dorcoceras hygrometricum TaxID=472368 RepID=A0A2Z7BEX7_9LAMI|nr:clp protease proteolytic subunit [Dorcoceras hygrometricum]